MFERIGCELEVVGQDEDRVEPPGEKLVNHAVTSGGRASVVRRLHDLDFRIRRADLIRRAVARSVVEHKQVVRPAGLRE
jgi:hypothetical protein